LTFPNWIPGILALLEKKSTFGVFTILNLKPTGDK